MVKPVVGIKLRGAGLCHGQAQADGQYLNENSHCTKSGVGKKNPNKSSFPVESVRVNNICI